jgi:ribosome-binding factor A
MSKAYPRNARVEEEIRRVVSELLLFEVKDPRLEGVTISGVKLSADRSLCRVYFSVVGDAEHERQVSDGFNAASSFFRREIGHRVRMRVTPALTFQRDQSFEYGDRMERLFDRLHAQGLMPEPEDGDNPEGQGRGAQGREQGGSEGGAANPESGESQ